MKTKMKGKKMVKDEDKRKMKQGERKKGCEN